MTSITAHLGIFTNITKDLPLHLIEELAEATGALTLMGTICFAAFWLIRLRREPS